MTSIENKIKVFIDTNVIIDAITKRDYEFKYSESILRAVLKDKIKGYICNKQITDIYYILSKHIKNEFINRDYIETIVETFDVLPLLNGDILACLKTPMKDFEDAIIDEVAKVNMIPYIVTNNIDDFKNSQVPAVTPEQFLTLFQLN